MKALKAIILLFAILFIQRTAEAQQFLTQINGWNAYVHLPWDYNSNSNNYPTIIFFPGLGEVGTNANKVISNGPGAYITAGWNGNVKVNADSIKFIVISLQPPSAYPIESMINTQIQAIKSLYRVDNNKLYLTGLSHGGWCSTTFVSGDVYGGPYTYASQVAAVVDVEGVKPDDNSPYPNLFDNFALSGGRYLGLEQTNDFRDKQTLVNRMNATKANSAIYMQTSFGNGGHCCWSSFYGGGNTQPFNFTLDGISQNIYQWMARQVLGGVVTPPANVAPVANAGTDKTITLPTNTTTLSGSGTDNDGTIASYLWTKISGPTAGTLSNSTSATATVSGLAQGIYNYELKVTDNKGATAVDAMQVTVNAAGNQLPVANAGTDKTITLPTNTTSLSGGGTDADGTISSYLWTKVSGPTAGTLSNSTSATASVAGLTQGVYQYQLKVTDNSGATAVDVMQVTVNATGVNQLPVANAGPDKVITLPTNSTTLPGTGTDADGTIAAYRWRKVAGPNTGSLSNTTSATATASNLVKGVYKYEFRVTDNNGASKRDTMQLTVNAAGGTNQAPIANAGTDRTITLPANASVVSGGGTDADGTIASYLWTQISGPTTSVITSSTAAQAYATNLTSTGVYQFQLKVTDNSNATSTDLVTVTVNASSGRTGEPAMRIQEKPAIGIPGEVKFDVMVYPNPVQTNMIVKINVDTIGQLIEIALIDQGGNTVYRKLVTALQYSNTIEIDMTRYKNGIYFLNTKAGTRITTRKIFKM